MSLKEGTSGESPFKRNIPAIVVNRLIDSTGWNMLEAVWQPFVLSLGASMSTLGGIASLYTGLLAALQLFTGRLSDAYGRRTIMIASYVISLASIVGALLAVSWVLLIPVVVLFAVADALLEPAIVPLVAESVEEGRRGTAFSLFALTWFLPGFYAPVAAGFLAERSGFHSVIVFLLVTEATSFLLFVAYVRETLMVRVKIALSKLLSSMSSVLKPRRDLLGLYSAVISHRFSYTLLEGIIYAMLLDARGFTVFEIGVLANVFSAAASISLIPVGRLLDRLGSRRGLVLAQCSWLLALAGYLASGSIVLFVASQAARGLAAALWEPSLNSYVSAAVNDSDRGRVFGNINGLRGLITFPAPLIGALLYEKLGYASPIAASFIINLVSIGLYSKIEPIPKSD